MITIRLQELLQKEGCTCRELSNITGIPYSTLLSMKNNTARYIRYEHLELLCRALHCEPDDILRFTPAAK
ncbi:MAG: helix-turn-helix transcriptional regulator [Clostridia bacterium]|nr:helix-turn-helix transcriptional regulator [Clostridia bacterium]